MNRHKANKRVSHFIPQHPECHFAGCIVVRIASSRIKKQFSFHLLLCVLYLSVAVTAREILPDQMAEMKKQQESRGPGSKHTTSSQESRVNPSVRLRGVEAGVESSALQKKSVLSRFTHGCVSTPVAMHYGLCTRVETLVGRDSGRAAGKQYITL